MADMVDTVDQERMLGHTHTSANGWVSADANRKEERRRTHKRSAARRESYMPVSIKLIDDQRCIPMVIVEH